MKPVRKKAGLLCGAAASALLWSTVAWAQARTFDVPSEDANKAIPEFARQAGIQIVASADQLDGVKTHDVKGALDVHSALKQLLAGTSIEIASDDGQTVVLRVRSKNAQAASDEGAAARDVETVVVTGTHIRGVEDTPSTVRTIDKTQIEQSGATNLADFMRTVPENFAGAVSFEGQAASAGGQFANRNAGYATGVDLRGLGSDSTLVLLDGFRLPFASTGYSADISPIPLAAISRVEMLKDGASSVYGSDAVAGVVNFITTSDFDGFQASATIGSATGGGKVDDQANALVGTTWSNGSFLAAYQFDHQDSLTSNNRAATRTHPGVADILPEQDMNSLFLSAHQNISSDLTTSANLLLSDRANHRLNSAYYPTTPVSVDTGRAEDANPELLLTGSAVYSFASGWNATLAGEYGNNSTHWRATDTLDTRDYPFTQSYRSQLSDVDLTFDGPLFMLPGGPAKLAVGGTYRSETFTSANVYTNFPSSSSAFHASRSIEAGFGEVFLPLVGPDSGAPGIYRLEVTASDRYEDYSDFGSTNNPKVGVLWSPNDELTARGTYSTSFRAPLLQETAAVPGIDFNGLANGPDPMSPTGTSLQILVIGSGNPNLKPQTAKSFTTGVDYRPHWLGGLQLTVDGFDIDYTNRIANPSPSPFLLLNPTLYSAYIVRNPSQALVNSLVNSPLFHNYGYVGPLPPTNVAAVEYNIPTNIGTQHVQGLDFEGRYTTPLWGGDLSTDVVASEFLKFAQTLSSKTATLFDTPYYPTKWRVRADIGWQSDQWSLHGALNYVNAYEDNRVPSAIVPVGSYTTFDTQVGYNVTTGWSAAPNDLQIRLSVLNLFDQGPPYLKALGSLTSGNYGFNYDGTNASILGRYISLTIVDRLGD